MSVAFRIIQLGNFATCLRSSRATKLIGTLVAKRPRTKPDMMEATIKPAPLAMGLRLVTGSPTKRRFHREDTSSRGKRIRP